MIEVKTKAQWMWAITETRVCQARANNWKIRSAYKSSRHSIIINHDIYDAEKVTEQCLTDGPPFQPGSP